MQFGAEGLSESLSRLIDQQVQELLVERPELMAHRDTNAQIRRDFLLMHDTWTATEVADWAGSTSPNRHAIASNWKAKGQIFSVRVDQVVRYPVFQFDMGRQKPYPEMKKIISALSPTYREWSLAIWFVTKNPWLERKAPLDLWPQQRKAVLAAAQSEQDTFDD
ncbi:MAG: hypothetical protein DWQ11_16915 [Proteobacteria bacterium]|nr:MAG: hypothetical protein DWQ11_16915 [Pseudomonadota bacterium]